MNQGKMVDLARSEYLYAFSDRVVWLKKKTEPRDVFGI